MEFSGKYAPSKRTTPRMDMVTSISYDLFA
jgi:hypothetical protein